MAGYVFDNAWRQARQRLRSLEKIADPGTIRRLETLEVAEGWRCLEVGGGGGSIAEWLCRRVGARGRVVATDVDTRFLAPISVRYANLEVWRHDLEADELPVRTFDLVHLRLVLAHVPARVSAVTRLAGALKPNGVLLVEELDLASVAPDPGCDAAKADRFQKVFATHLQVWEGQGGDPFLGRRLPRLMRAHGLAPTGADGRAFVWRGGSPDFDLLRLTFEQLRTPMIATGRVSAKDVDATLALFDDPDFTLLSPIIMAAWGRRPKTEPANTSTTEGVSTFATQ